MKIGEKTPWTRMFWSDFAADTYHLDPMHLGIYMKLLLFMYQHARALPSEKRMLAKICGASSDTEQLVINEVINEYFHPFEDPEHGLVYRHHRVEREIEHAWNTQESYKRRGAKGGRPKKSSALAEKNLSFSSAKAERNKPEPEPEPEPERDPEEKKENRVGDRKRSPNAKNRGSRFDLDTLPADWEAFCKSERPDLNPQATFDRFRDHWVSVPGQKGVKLDWKATWRNWVRNERRNNSGAESGPKIV